MRRTLIFAASLAGLTIGCSDHPALTTEGGPAGESGLSLRTARKDGGAGAVVQRGGTQVIIITDPDRDFVLTIGVPLSEAPECGGTGEIKGTKLLQVSTPGGVDHLVVQAHQQPMTLYGHFSEDFCDLPQDDVVADGRGNAKLVIMSRAGTTLFMIQATGTVKLVDGGFAHLTVKGQFHIEPDGTLRVHVDRFRLQPIGT